ncbi:hypothetical protein HMPREF9582_02597 [Cutibacterium acnes HL060PA1]|nr:hypothetical protein HMPREF9603_00582 [Cutibacterium acnes HL001PA1]EFT09215.1 hypothetical protein HMPREF9619_02344 [Cutibacterium acnes HL082PA2]EFT26145.1 hypothetical protein HMPREF9577_01235 [Cutibacterium acnes HL110PA3]EFT62889.1 hypothetical protein HMPREF9578_01620 [Cutibacterium acnes HL110PA4]EFT66617.1 hypothetical protein HMPREF9582_02597 [Cutibacterium acnes HL060PA1]EGE66820.1 hypothetical protein HMPREF9341_02542 [Cutibacterium acnes HL103PA1]
MGPGSRAPRPSPRRENCPIRSNDAPVFPRRRMARARQAAGTPRREDLDEEIGPGRSS